MLLPRGRLSSAVAVRTRDRVLALTYDDGPDPVRTPAVLDVLGEFGAHATFFMLADRARAYPEVVARVLSEGHEVGLHGVDHTRVTAYGPEAFRAKLVEGRRSLEELTGRKVSLYRPAYGAFQRSQVRIVKELGLEPVIWSGWARDWQDDPVEEITGRALRGAHPGGILLLHDYIADQDITERSHDCAAWTRGLLEGLGDGWQYPTTSQLLTHYPHYRCPWFESDDAPRGA